jgi:hypothetical protein
MSKEVMGIRDSPAVELMAHLWGHRQEATGHSWLRMSQGLHEGLMLAVKLGIQFNDNDLSEIGNRFRGGYWFGSNFESFYTCAVVYGNRSAWKAYEAYRNRKPFIWTPAHLRDNYGGGGQGMSNPPRLTVRCEFVWKGEQVTLTSFNDEKGYLVAQSYTRDEAKECKKCGRQTTWPQPKILHRFTITHADLKAAKEELRLAARGREKGNEHGNQ